MQQEPVSGACVVIGVAVSGQAWMKNAFYDGVMESRPRKSRCLL